MALCTLFSTAHLHSKTTCKEAAARPQKTTNPLPVESQGQSFSMTATAFVTNFSSSATREDLLALPVYLEG